jgi:hypothetical protein
VQPRLVFISHSSKDAKLAGALSDLLQASLRLSNDQILCTSIDGHKLPVGANIEKRLRKDLKAAQVVIALITPNSMSSRWVMIEIGARWLTDQLLVPLLAGIEPPALGPPLSNLNALSAANENHLQQLLHDTSESLGLPIQNSGSNKRRILAVTALASQVPAEEGVLTRPDKSPEPAPQRPLHAQATVDSVAGLQSSRVFLKEGQQFLLEPEGRIHLASDQVDNFARAAKPLIVKYAKGRKWSAEIKRRYKLPKFDQASIFYRGWVGPEGELHRSDMLEHCKLRPDLNWGALLAVILPVKAPPSADPFLVLASNEIKLMDLIPVPQRTEKAADRDGWLTFIVNDAVISPYSPSEDGKVFYHALKDAAQALSRNRHQVPQTLPLPLAFYSDNLGAFRITMTIYPMKKQI